MKLYRNYPLFEGTHRYGWPMVWRHLAEVASGEGLLLDDFVDATYSYKPKQKPHVVPWVGIFHHPVEIESPLREDQKWPLEKMLLSREFQQARHKLRGAIALSQSVATFLRDWLDVPVFLIKHPTTTDVPQWHKTNKTLWQTGWFLRDTQYMQHAKHPLGWGLMRSVPTNVWDVERCHDLALIRYQLGIRKCNAIPIDVPRISNTKYDDMLTQCVVYSKLFGAAANNVIIDCMARNTPIVVNRLPDVEFYLGPDYPLYLDNWEYCVEQMNYSACELLAYDAHNYLRSLDKSWMVTATFAHEVNQFVDGL
jgi:hypothetical protein